jgi:putative ABC transport system permease protein
VGVAGDVRDTALESDAKPCIYIPYPQFPSTGMTLVVRAAVDPKPLIPAIRDGVWAVDKDQPVTDIKTMDQSIADSVSPRRFNAMLLAIFASLALVLASVGIYGVMALGHSANARDRDSRRAGRNRRIHQLIVARYAVVISGVARDRALARLLMTSRMACATDPLTFAGVSVLLVTIALLASYIPAASDES